MPYFILLILCTMSTCCIDAQVITPLPDGLLVQQGPVVKVEEGLWTLVVTIDDPIQLYGPVELQWMSTQARRLMIFARNFDDDTYGDEHTKRAWVQRLEILTTLDSSRTKRGAIDVIGQASKWLFGTATMNDISTLQRQIDRLAHSDSAVIHQSNLLLTVINQTRLAETETRDKLNDLINQFENNCHQEERRWTSIQALQKALLLEELISFLESIGHHVQQAMNVLHRRQMALSDGHLSEDLLPPLVLQEMMTQMSDLGMVPLAESWYYTHATVQLLMRNNFMMVYQTELPVVGRDEYQAYVLNSWPVPTNGSGLAVGLVVTPNIAFHSMSGKLFHPTDCQGYRPKVCRTGPMYIGDTFACERGLITGHIMDRSKCSFNIDHMTVVTNFYPIGRGEYVLQTLGETYSFSCEGQRPAKEDLSSGIFYVSVPERCEFAGRGWILRGEVLQYSNMTIRDSIFPIEQFNISDLFSKFNVPATQANIAINTLSPLINVDMSPLDPNRVYDWGHTYDAITHNMSWSNVFIIIIICICLLFAARYVWLHRDQLKLYFRDAQLKAMPLVSGGSDQPLPDSEGIELTYLGQPPVEPVGSMV